MKRSSAWLLMVVLSIVCGCSRKQSTEVRGPNPDEPRQAQPDGPSIKAATPEDTTGIITVVRPLEILRKQGKSSPATLEAALPQESAQVDHAVFIAPGKPKNVLHQVFPVRDQTEFSFVIPPQQANTRLRGTFRSFTKRSDPDSTSDQTADVELMLLNEQEFNQFLHGRMQSATDELDPCHSQVVDWRVPTAFGEPQRYHVVFSNSPGGAKIKFVEADFTVSFE